MPVSLPYQPPLHIGLDILFEDKDIVVVNKPSGLLSVPGRGIDKQDCMLSRLQLEYPTALTVHRLDMPTSGIMIFALNKNMQKLLGILFEKRNIHKQYIARVYGALSEKSGIINQPLITDWPNRPKQKIDYKTGKPSITKFHRLSTDNNSSMIQLQPVTGRSHQLRVHMSSLGHPILGDKLYGIYQSRTASDRLLLHAEKLSFMHPVTDHKIEIICKADFT